MSYFVKQILLAMLIFSAVFLSCNSPYVSKKKGYFAIDFPEHAYQAFNRPGFPYTFDYPLYADIVQDSTYFDSNPENPYWINVDFPRFNARIFLSYKKIGGKALYKIKQADDTYRDSIGTNYFDQMVNDAFNLTSKNDIVATSIKDSLMRTPNAVSGVYFTVGGNAATGRQFFLSDTTRHFLRGALYFNATPNADSIRPVQEFLQQDIFRLINSFRWVNQ